jgi:hypothetical protein
LLFKKQKEMKKSLKKVWWFETLPYLRTPLERREVHKKIEKVIS